MERVANNANNICPWQKKIPLMYSPTLPVITVINIAEQNKSNYFLTQTHKHNRKIKKKNGSAPIATATMMRNFLTILSTKIAPTTATAAAIAAIAETAAAAAATTIFRSSPGKDNR